VVSAAVLQQCSRVSQIPDSLLDVTNSRDDLQQRSGTAADRQWHAPKQTHRCGLTVRARDHHLAGRRAPKLRDALAAARNAGHAFVVTGGTLIPIDRVSADRPFYSGKHRRHGKNLLVISSPAGARKPASHKAANSAHARLRAPGQRANAQLKTWGILPQLRCCPWRAGQIAKAIHVLQTREIAG
jgi:hypothetical protein